LIEQYINQQKSIRELSREFKKDRSTFKYWLQKYNIPIRSNGEAKHLLNANSVILSNEAKEFIYGELLGDMCIRCYSNYTASIIYTSKYKEYIKWLNKILVKYGIEISGEIHKSVSKLSYNNKEHLKYHYSSLCYPELLEIRNIFYKNNIKIVPENLILTPILVRQWYIGDGYLETTNNSIRICTDNFTKSEIEMLIHKFKDIGIECTITRLIRKDTKYRIRVRAKSKIDFLDYIGKCPKEINNIYGYKFIKSYNNYAQRKNYNI